MRVLVSGGCKNGKSTHAEQLAFKASADGRPLYYIATMLPCDKEDDERIARHRQNRAGMGFITVEQHFDIANILQSCDKNGSFLLDSTTALLANEMFKGGEFLPSAVESVAEGLTTLLIQLDYIVIVSDYIYSDAALYDEYTLHYRRSLARIDRLCAEMCDVVAEVANTAVVYHKQPSGVEK